MNSQYERDRDEQANAYADGLDELYETAVESFKDGFDAGHKYALNSPEVQAVIEALALSECSRTYVSLEHDGALLQGTKHDDVGCYKCNALAKFTAHREGMK